MEEIRFSSGARKNSDDFVILKNLGAFFNLRSRALCSLLRREPVNRVAGSGHEGKETRKNGLKIWRERGLKGEKWPIGDNMHRVKFEIPGRIESYVSRSQQ